MGMFDSIKCKMPLPVSGEVSGLGVSWNEEVYQTKDLDNMLGYYEITEDGRLRCLRSRIGWAEGDREEVEEDGGNGEVEEWSDVDFHGRIRFYTGYCDNPEYRWDYSKDADQLSWSEIMDIEGHDWWVEFEATFDNGKCRDIKLLPPEKTTVRSRLANSKEWAMRREQESRTLFNRTVSKLRKIPGWKRVLRGAIRAESGAHNALSRILHKIA